MSASYDPKLPTALDWVRFLIGDTTITSAVIDDDEITAILTDYSDQYDTGTWIRYLAAADILDAMIARWVAAGGGVMEKEVSKLRIKRGFEESGLSAARRRVMELRAEGARRRLSPPRTFEML